MLPFCGEIKMNKIMVSWKGGRRKAPKYATVYSRHI